MNATECKPFPLVRSEACEIWRCRDCGAVHIYLGAVSLRLKQAHFENVGEAMLLAVHKLEQLKSMSGEQGALLRSGAKPN